MSFFDIFKSNARIAYETAVASGRSRVDALRAEHATRELGLDADGARAIGRTGDKFHAYGVQRARDELKLNSIGTLAYDLSGGDKFVAYDAQRKAELY